MQRNKSLAKEILEFIVGNDNGGYGLYRSEINDAFAKWHPTPEQGREESLDYHLRILETAGFVRHSKDDERDEDSFEMTWAGHDFLENDSEH